MKGFKRGTVWGMQMVQGMGPPSGQCHSVRDMRQFGNTGAKEFLITECYPSEACCEFQAISLIFMMAHPRMIGSGFPVLQSHSPPQPHPAHCNKAPHHGAPVRPLHSSAPTSGYGSPSSTPPPPGAASLQTGTIIPLSAYLVTV